MLGSICITSTMERSHCQMKIKKNKKPIYDWYKGKPIGIDDKHGNPIKEGDIVSIKEIKIAPTRKKKHTIEEVVEYSEDLCAFTLHAFLFLLRISPDSHNVGYEFEIIGTRDEH